MCVVSKGRSKSFAVHPNALKFVDDIHKLPRTATQSLCIQYTSVCCVYMYNTVNKKHPYIICSSVPGYIAAVKLLGLAHPTHLTSQTYPL